MITICGCCQQKLIDFDISLAEALLIRIASQRQFESEGAFREFILTHLPALKLKNDSIRRKIRRLQKIGIFSATLDSGGFLTDKGKSVLEVPPRRMSPPSSSSSLNSNSGNDKKKISLSKPDAARFTRTPQNFPAQAVATRIYQHFFLRQPALKQPIVNLVVWYDVCRIWRDKNYNPANLSGLCNMYAQAGARASRKAQTTYWEVITGILEGQLNAPSFNTWIRPLQTHENGSIVYLVPDREETHYWLETYYMKLLTSHATMLGCDVKLVEAKVSHDYANSHNGSLSQNRAVPQNRSGDRLVLSEHLHRRKD